MRVVALPRPIVMAMTPGPSIRRGYELNVPFAPRASARSLVVMAISASFVLALPAAVDARGPDRDRDGLSNRLEVKVSRTDPRRSDTDGDGLRDGYEVRQSRTSPRRADTDGDGLSDGYEVRRSLTSPRRADTDGDGASDSVELAAGTDPKRRQSKPGKPGPTSQPAPQPAPAPAPAPQGAPEATPEPTPDAPADPGTRHDRAEHDDLVGSERHGLERLCQLRVHRFGVCLYVRVPDRRWRLGVVHIAEGVLGPGEPVAHIRRAGHRRGWEHGRVAGGPDLDRQRARAVARCELHGRSVGVWVS